MQLFCVGDIALSGNFTSSWLPPGCAAIGDEEKILFNWELPIGKSINPIPRTSGPRLLSHPNSVNAVQKWAPGFAALATNHILDGGEDGLAETVAALRQAGFQTVGAGLSVDEMRKPLFWETREGRLAVVNWVFPETHPDWMVVPGPNCWPGLEEAGRTIQELGRKTDWVLIVVHWSDENFSYPRPEDRAIARELAQMGADIVIGHHPHVVRGMQIIGACPVFYSIGNFYMSDFSDRGDGWILQQAPRNREGLGVQISFERGRMLEYRTLSFWQARRQIVIDPIQRAGRRMERISRPLQRFQDSAYDAWYTRKRARFDKWGAAWHFGFRRLGIRGLIRYVFRQSLSNLHSKSSLL